MGALEAAVEKLNPPKQIGPFLLRYCERNPRIGQGAGSRGVEGERLIFCYQNAFELALARFQSKPHLRELPKNPIPVYLLDILALPYGSPFMSVNVKGDPFIVLPSRIAQFTPQAELEYAAACAVHEFLHVLREVVRPYAELMLWRWFDEATAVWGESLVVEGNRTCYEYYLDWSDKPEVPIDNEMQSYGAALFVRYLTVRQDEGFVSRVWKEAKRGESPLQTIKRLLPKNQKEGIFHDYCVDSYFAQAGGRPTLFAEVHEHYGGRAISESFDAARGGTIEFSTEVDPLACRFYRFYPGPGVTRMEATLDDDASGVRASLAGVGAGLSRTVKQGKKPVVRVGKPPMDHVILVLSNDGSRKLTDTKISVRVSAA